VYCNVVHTFVISQLYMEYCSIAVKGAIAAVDGNIPPLNRSEHVKYCLTLLDEL